MSETTDFETLIERALAPVDPPTGLSDRLEARLTRITERAADELDAWEIETLRDPRNWGKVVRPAAAVVVGGGAAAALVLLQARRRAAARSGRLRGFIKR
jgi:hypothetical protein